MKRIIFIISASVWIIPATLAAQAPLGWPEVIALLAKAKTQATACVGVLKTNGDKAAIAMGVCPANAESARSSCRG